MSNPLLKCFTLISVLVIAPVTQAEMITAVNLSDKGIDFSIEGAGGPLMGPNEDGSASGSVCCAPMPVWSPNLKVTVLWKANKNPYSYEDNPYKTYTKEWRAWRRENNKKIITYHKAIVSVPKYTGKTAGNMIGIFLPCDQVMVVNTTSGYKSDSFPQKALIQKRLKELRALEKANRCPALQFPAQQQPYKN